tara:strand:- start:43 stop:450 length:408 start_codon:yes stop_codon:yes gene_type:complete
MISKTVMLPITGEAVRLVVRPNGTRFAEGSVALLGISELFALVGSTPQGLCEITVLDHDIDNSQATSLIEYEDASWQSDLDGYFASKDTASKIRSDSDYLTAVTDGAGETGAIVRSGSRKAADLRMKLVTKSEAF